MYVVLKNGILYKQLWVAQKQQQVIQLKKQKFPLT